MENISKIKGIVGIVLIVLLIFTTRVYAANDSFKTTIATTNTQVKRGDTVTITIGLKDIAIESGEKGIGGYTANIKFDSSVLEYVSTNGTDKWEAPFYQNGLITGNTKDGEVVKTTQSIGTITFRVKKDAQIGETDIRLTNFSGTTAENDVDTDDQNIKITIIGDNSNNNNNSNNSNDNSNSNNNNINNENKTNGSNYIKNDILASGRLPKAGDQKVTLIVCILLVIICSVIFYIKMKSI